MRSRSGAGHKRIAKGLRDTGALLVVMRLKEGQAAEMKQAQWQTLLDLADGDPDLAPTQVHLVIASPGPVDPIVTAFHDHELWKLRLPPFGPGHTATWSFDARPPSFLPYVGRCGVLRAAAGPGLRADLAAWHRAGIFEAAPTFLGPFAGILAALHCLFFSPTSRVRVRV